MKKRILTVLFFAFVMTSFIHSVRLFYLSTDRTFSGSEQKRIKIESGYGIDSLKIRIYKINDLTKFYLSQNDFHRPKIQGRNLRYFSPDLVTDFFGYFRSNVRDWARQEIPPKTRESMINRYPDMSRNSSEDGLYPSKIVNAIQDKNFSLISETNYVLQNKKGGWNYNYAFMDAMKEGTYLVEGVSTDNVAYTVLNVSDYGFIVKKGNEDMLLYTVRTDNAAPLGEVELTVYNRFKKELTKVKTDANGIAKLNVKDNDLFILGKSKQNTYTFFDPKYFPSNVRDNSVYIYTERPVYRGGDEVFLKGILRKYKDDQYNTLNTEKDVKIEIVDPRGAVIFNGAVKTTKEGIFNYNFTLSKDAKSGRYLMIADIDSKKYEAEFKVEYYIKPEFTVNVSPDKNIVIGGDKIKAKISAAYYYGDPVKNVRCRYSIYKTRYNEESWSKNQDKSFYLTEAEYVYSQMELIKTGEIKLNDEGKASLDIDTKKESYAYNYSMQLVVNKDTGSPVTGSGGVLIVPSNMKIKLDADKFVYLVNENIEVTIFSADYENNPLSKSIHLKVSSDTDTKNEYIYQVKEAVTNNKGLATFTFKAAKAGFVKIEASGLDEKGNKISAEKFLWIGQEGATYTYKGGRINLALDKSFYKPGDTAKLLILSPVSDVKVLATIEGDTVYNYSIEKLTANSLLLNIPIKKNYLPNVFADISFIFGNEFYNNTIKINVPPDSQFLNINITSDSEIYNPKAKGKFKMKVTDSNKAPLKNTDLSVAVVDEKIYAISKEIAIDIRNYFYSFRKNNIMTWSSIGYRFYGYSMDANTELSRKFSKDSTSLAAFKESEAERKTFKDTALWIPSLKTDDKGEASFEVDFPDNITKWRVTAIGVTPDTKVGRSVYSVITKMTFFSDLVVPNVLTLKDNAVIYTTVHNNSNETLKTDFTLSGENVDIKNAQTQIVLAGNSEKTLEWQIKPLKTGEMTLKLKVANNKYTDIISKKINVIPNSIEKIVSSNRQISEKDYSLNINLPDDIDLKQENQKFHLTLSHGYASIIVDSLPYLINYPYGCVEQTTSSFLPNLVASTAIKKFNITFANQGKNLNDIINAGLGKLYGFQQQNGSWGWFNENRIDIFMTSYVLYALTLTKEAGYSVSASVLKSGLNALENNIDKSQNDLEKLYALYVLSMNNKKIYSMLEPIMKNTNNLDDYQLAILLLTLVNYGKMDDASKISDLLKKRAVKEGSDKLYWGTKKTEYWYKDSVETSAWVVKSLTKYNKEKGVVSKVVSFFTDSETDEILKKGLSWLVFQEQGNHWKSTRDTAACIFAFTDYLDSQDFNDDKTYKVKLNNSVIGQITFNRKNFNSSIDLNIKDIASQFKNKNDIQIEGVKKGDNLFVSAYLSYFTTSENIAASSNNISIKRKYYSLKENRSGDSIKYSFGRELTSAVKGNNILVELEVTSPKAYEYLFIEDFIPSGCTFMKDFLIYNIEGIDKKWKADYTDFRDNKVNFFLTRSGSVKLYYVVTPVYKGSYKVIPAAASLMYFPETKANSNDDKFSIE